MYISLYILKASSLLELLSFSARLRHYYPVRLAPTDKLLDRVRGSPSEQFYAHDTRNESGSSSLKISM